VTLSDNVLRKVASEWSSGSEATVLKCLLALIDDCNGCMDGSQLGLLYKLHPESKALVKHEGGIAKFCLRFRQYVRHVVADNGGFQLVKPTL